MSTVSGSPVLFAWPEDPEMKEAVARAGSSFKYLWRELTWEYRRIVPALELSAIKAAFKDPEAEPVEHMWLSDIDFDGDVISAHLLNSPRELTSVKEGDRVTLRLEEIEDWMYVLQGQVFGGFTIQVLRSRMSTGERRGHDKAWGFDFGDPSRVALTPNWQEKGKGLLGRLFARGQTAPSDPDAEHPMSENMAGSLTEAVAQNREALFEPGPDGLSALHSLSLGGSAACVRVLLEAGADPHLKTKSGKTARDLATLMGWPRVVTLLREAEAAS
jgi:uncharacterized protein YegJ (DUF2314 family)